MTNRNDYVTWATGVGANIAASPAAYAAMTIRQLGAQIGIADPVSFNNAMRQASVVAAMIAQFTADQGPGNVNDDGNVATLETQFIDALQTLIAANLPAPPTGFLGPYYGTDSGSADAIHVTNLNPAISSYVAGQLFLINVAHDNLTTTPTFQNNALSALTITRADGTACQPYDMRGGADMLFACTGSGMMLLGRFATDQSVNGVGPYYGTDSGAADAIQINNLSPTITAYKDGELFLIDVAHNNATTTPYIQIASLGHLTITRADGTACKANDIQASSRVLIACTGSGAQLVGVYTNFLPGSQIQSFSSSTTWTVPAGVYALKRVRIWGAGGGGGGSLGTGGGSSSSGGGGGGYSEAANVPVVPGSSITVTIGAGGTGGVGNGTGTTGGTSTFGSPTPVSATGGTGGTANATNTPGVGGSGSGGQVNLTGQNGGISSASGGQGVNGMGGGAPFGGGTPTWGVIFPTGAGGLFPGGGASGAAIATSGTGTGGAGAGGFIEIEF